MAATDARPIARKNTAYRVTFPIWDADGDLVTGATGLDSEVSIDGAAFADCTNEATEIATASGMYYLDLTAAEMNGDTVAVIVKTSTSGAKTTPMVFYPEELGDIRVDVAQISGDATAADNAEAYFDGTGYAGTGNTIPTVTTVTNMVTANVTQLSGDATAADNAESFFDGTGYAGTGNVIPSVTTVTGNVNGSVASVTGAVGSVTGNVGGNVSGSVGSVTGNLGGDVAGSVASVTADVGITQAGADKVWGSTTRTLSAFGFSVTVGTNNDKTGYALSSSGVQAIWDALTSALSTANSIGKRIADNLNATVDSRLATADYTAPDNAGITTLTGRLTAPRATLLDNLDAAISSRLATFSYTAPDNTTIAAIATVVDTEVGAIKTITDRVGGMLELDGAVYRYTVNALEQAPSGGGGGSGATPEEIWTYTDRTLTQFGALTGVEFTYTLTDSTTALPIEGARVAFTTDEAGSNVVWVGYTDAFGVARDTLGNLPSLDAGTYYVWRGVAGYTFSNPDTEVVS